MHTRNITVIHTVYTIFHSGSFVRLADSASSFGYLPSRRASPSLRAWKTVATATALQVNDDDKKHHPQCLDRRRRTRSVYLMLEPGESADPQVLTTLTGLVRLLLLRSLLHLLDLRVRHFTEHQLLGQAPRRNRCHQLTQYKPTNNVPVPYSEVQDGPCIPLPPRLAAVTFTFDLKNLTSHQQGASGYYPCESEGIICFHRRWFVCLCVCPSLTTITKKIVDGFAPNFMRRFLGEREDKVHVSL